MWLCFCHRDLAFQSIFLGHPHFGNRDLPLYPAFGIEQHRGYQRFGPRQLHKVKGHIGGSCSVRAYFNVNVWGF